MFSILIGEREVYLDITVRPVKFQTCVEGSVYSTSPQCIEQLTCHTGQQHEPSSHIQNVCFGVPFEFFIERMKKVD